MLQGIGSGNNKKEVIYRGLAFSSEIATYIPGKIEVPVVGLLEYELLNENEAKVLPCNILQASGPETSPPDLAGIF
jgi:hypothetical protein